MTHVPHDGWNAAASYEAFMGRWSRPMAEALVSWLSPEPEGHWLDVGCGTGALTAAICAGADPASVIGCDPSAPFVEAARRSLSDGRADFRVSGVGELPARPGGYDHVVSSLALNFFPDPAGAVAEQLTLARTGGAVVALVWDYAEGMEMLRRFWDAASAVVPGSADLDEGRRFPLCRPEPLAGLFHDAGAADVRVEPLEIPTDFADFDDYWRPFTGGTGPAPSLVASLPEAKVAALAGELARRLPGGGRGAVRLRARAWAVAGRRP